MLSLDRSFRTVLQQTLKVTIVLGFVVGHSQQLLPKHVEIIRNCGFYFFA